MRIFAKVDPKCIGMIPVALPIYLKCFMVITNRLTNNAAISHLW